VRLFAEAAVQAITVDGLLFRGSGPDSFVGTASPVDRWDPRHPE
jgi:hypothetical protein